MIKSIPKNCQEAIAFLEQCKNFPTRAQHAYACKVTTRSIDSWRERSELILKSNEIFEKYTDSKSDITSYTPDVKILFWDLEMIMAETKPMHIWDSIGVDIDSIQPWQIERYKSIAMGAFSWLGQSTVHLTSVRNNKELFKKDPFNDYVVVSTLREVISHADIIVAHNGDAFDWKHFKARCAYHGISCPKPVKMIDTMKIARKHFGRGAMGNSIDNLARFLNLEDFKSYSPDWYKIARGNEAELVKCGDYCKMDVKVLKQIFVKLWDLGFIDNINLNPILGTSNNCKACGRSGTLEEIGEMYTNSHAYFLNKCTSCNTHQKGDRVRK